MEPFHWPAAPEFHRYFHGIYNIKNYGVTMSSSHDKERVISLADIIALLRGNVRNIIVITLVLGGAAFLYGLTYSVSYTVNATFKEGGVSSKSGGGSFKDLVGLWGSGSNDDKAMHIILSDCFLHKQVREHNLQAGVTSKSFSPYSLPRRMYENVKILVDKGRRRYGKCLIIDDIVNDIACEHVEYSGEFSRSLDIKLVGKDTFEVYDKKEKVAQGSFGERIAYDDVTFALRKNDEGFNNAGGEYSLSFTPLHNVMNGLKANIGIEPRKGAANILEMSFRHRDRHFAAKFLNSIMAEYHNYIKEDSRKRVEEQLGYLEERQKDAQGTMAGLLEDYKGYLTENVGYGAFTEVGDEIIFLAKNKEKSKSDLLALEIEDSLLDNAQESPDILSKQILYENDSDVSSSLKGISKRIRDLVRQRDSLVLSLEQKKEGVSQKVVDQIEHRVAIMEERLRNEVLTYKKSIACHKGLIEKQIGELKVQMQHIPEKWFKETTFKMYSEMEMQLVKKVTELVESTVISHNIETIESKALDFAYPETKPDMPKALILAFLGVFLGLGGSTFFTVARGFYKGVVLSAEALALEGRHVSGEVSYDDGEARKMTLREIMTFVHPSHKKNSSVLLALGAGVDYSSALADLAIKRGYNVLVIEDISQDSEVGGDGGKGLLQYLEGESVTVAPERHQRGYDVIRAGGTTAYAMELRNSRRYHEALEKMKEEYDLVFVVTREEPLGLAVASYTSEVDGVVIALAEETKDSLEAFEKRIVEKKMKKITYVFTNKKI
jgi:uncharacterized protein involved in exopolysaccharide biosynthesis